MCIGCDTAVATAVGAHLVGPMWKDLVVAQRLHRGGERSWCRLILTHCGKKSDMPCKGCVAQGHSNACFLTMRSAPRGVVLGVKTTVSRVLCNNSRQIASHPCHTPSFTQIFVTPSFTHIFVTHRLEHTTSSIHTFFHTHLCHTPS